MLFGPKVVEVEAPAMSGGTNEPCLCASRDLKIAYRASSGMLEERWVVAYFDTFTKFCFGHPNEEVLHGHALYSKGLRFYSVHEVLDSPWIKEIEKVNSVHSRHSKELFEDERHWIFTFQDETLEVVSRKAPVFSIIDASSANDALQK